MLLLLTLRPAPGADVARELELDGRDVVIGRGQEADWTLPDPTQQVSTRHCRLHCRDGQYMLVDTSTNGTLLNGARLTTAQPLRAGDEIRIGPFHILVTDQSLSVKSSVGMDLSSWDRQAPGPTATDRPGPGAVPPSARADASSREESLARGLAVLLATRARQRRELGMKAPDPLARNPLSVDPDRVASALVDARVDNDVVFAAVDAIERHHAATLHAMRGAFRAALDRISPEAVSRAAEKVVGNAEAQDAALWRAYVRAFSGVNALERGFVETFADEFRQACERLTGDAAS